MPFSTLSPSRRTFIALAGSAALSACGGPPTPAADDPVTRYGFTPVEGYGPLDDNGYHLPPIPPNYLEWPNRRQLVFYEGERPAGTIEIDPWAKFLYWIIGDGTAWRYPIAVGRAGLTLRGQTTIRRKEVWPGWQPTANMLRTQPEVYGPFARGVPGGLASPLGARALYLYRGGKDSYYRIHGTNDLESIGNSGSAGCIRLFNHDIIDLFDRISIPTEVSIRTLEDSQRLLGPANTPRGVELPPKIISPETIYGATEPAVDPGT
ncbi:L,D-transpeptidase [Frigidibacter sp. RF13]|uniref:L,D-transpeptidase n=1 Tax=Frigidibacter sp. RF13 TaxID=2997340 RepID=UPI002270C36E|nr:L,D-transpeptidase [Frigidibacter sp. RF13]MCY1126882.1 L,D-transpeptidase [Frigidibacter sp. RF13]